MSRILKVAFVVLVLIAAIAVAIFYAVAWAVLLASCAAGLGIAYLAHLLLCWLEDKFG